ncbi:sec1 family domain-containing protein 2-like [Centruroides vittatus]|uniref:sec1 family domain-containing protein 2-like n=1 Tax=Centruroides vittatus TaxID=120091 RepID=UPI00350EE260
MAYQAIKEIFRNWWDEICTKVDKAVVFLDFHAAESLHWNGGLLKLINAGAKTVKVFSPFERGEEMEDKVVFIITTPLLEEELHALQIILQSSSFIYCIVITTVPEFAYSERKSITEEGKHLFYSLEEKLINYMGNMSYTAEIIYLPVPGINVGTNFFLLPSFENIFPSFNHSSGNPDTMHEKNWKETAVEDMLSLQNKAELKAMAHYFDHLFEQIQVKEDIFSLGNFSNILGMELEMLASAKNRRKTSGRKVSLLLIDRTLDLAGPLSQNCHSMLDRIIRILPHLPGHTCDVAVDMGALSSSFSGQVFGISLLAPGCLADESEISTTILDYLLLKKQKDCLMHVNRLVVEKATKHGFDIESGILTRRITADQIEKHVKLFRNNFRALNDNIGLLQCALAVVQTMQHSNSNILDEIQSTEQLLLQNLAMSAEDTYRNLLYLIDKRNERSLSLSIIISIISYVYMLDNGEILGHHENEQKLQAALVEAIFQESNNLPSFLTNLIGDSLDENSVISSVNTIFSQLKNINSERKKLKKYKSLFQPGDTISPAVYVPLLKQLFEDLTNPSNVDLSDVEFHSSGFTDSLKSRFSMFMNIAKPKPTDNPCIIVFVLGGITATEVHQIREIVANSSHEVIIGSTRLVTPNDIIEKIFKNSDYEKN